MKHEEQMEEKRRKDQEEIRKRIEAVEREAEEREGKEREADREKAREGPPCKGSGARGH